MPSPSTSETQFVKPGDVFVEEPVQVVGYKLGGDETDPRSPDCVAKSSFDPSSKMTRYYVRYVTTGPDAGRMFNPDSTFFNHGSQRRVNEYMGRDQFEFRKVDKGVFDLYLDFLKTRNPMCIRNAERAR